MTRIPTPSRIAFAVALAVAQWGAQAQTAAPSAAAPAASAPSDAASAPAEATPPAKAPEASTDGLKLDNVIVTGTSSRTTKMNSSVSVSTLNAEEVKRSGATSAAEVLRSVPGIRSESSSGESNANMTVRGLPLSAGGSRYLQLQEDGLPIQQFGDSNFVTPDNFLRVDNNLDRIEAIRGGNSATLATNAPGGIVNFISKTGTEKGGVGSLSIGSGNLRRYELGYGGSAGEKTRFYFGGHYRTSDGPRNGGIPIEEGGQIKGNVTQDFDNGFVRVYFKHLNDRSASFLPLPANRAADGTLTAVDGFDFRTSSFNSPYLIPDVTLTGDNGHTSTNPQQGFKVKSDAVGFETEVNLGSGIKLTDKFRTAHNSGRFVGIFAGGNGTPAANPGTTYLTGPNAGKPYTGNTYTAVLFNTNFDDLSLTANDLRVSKTFGDLDSGKATVTGGLYTSSQRVALTWSFNQYLFEAKGDKPALLNDPTFVQGSPGFGGCCMRTEDVVYDTVAPYAVLAFERDNWNVDLSVRNDRQRATGSYNATNFNPDATQVGLAYDPATTQSVDYTASRTSYSLGGNYKLSKDLALFARYSDGVSFNGNRISNTAATTGTRGVDFRPVNAVDGSKPIPLNTTQQLEFGTKVRFGGLSAFVTLFQAKTTESNINITNTASTLQETTYEAKGVEVEGSYKLGGLRVTAGATYTDAKVTAAVNAANIGQRPLRQAKLIYQLSPSYEFGDLSAGLAFVGTTKALDNGAGGGACLSNCGVIGGFVQTNLFTNYRLSDRASVLFSVNNLFDVIGITESNGSNARSINGRTYRATISYDI